VPLAWRGYQFRKRWVELTPSDECRACLRERCIAPELHLAECRSAHLHREIDSRGRTHGHGNLPHPLERQFLEIEFPDRVPGRAVQSEVNEMSSIYCNEVTAVRCLRL